MNNIIKQIEKFCKEENVTLTSVKFENQSDSFHIDWEKGLNEFLEFTKETKCKYLFIDNLIIQYELYKSTIEEVRVIDKNLSEEIKDLLNMIKNMKDKVIKTTILASVDGNNIFFTEFSDEAESFFEITDKLENLIEIAKNDTIEEPVLRYHERKKLMEPFAIELANHKDYYRTLISDDEQNSLIDKVLGDRPFHIKGYDKKEDPWIEYVLRNDIKNLAKAHFKIHVEPELEKEFIQKIKEWKILKIPKIEMTSKLGISMKKLNEYYYKV